MAGNRKKYIIFFLLVIITLALPFCKSTRHIRVHGRISETLKNDVPKNYSQFLIAGAGSSFCRLFSENLTEALKPRLLKSGVSCNYEHLGSDSLTALKRLNELYRQLPAKTALLIMVEGDSGVISITDDIFLGFELRNVSYSETMSLILIDKQSKPVIVWKATLELVFDPRKRNMYYSIANKVVDRLKANKILPL